MTPAEFSRRIVLPGLETLAVVGGPVSADPPHRLLIAIAIQESGLRSRYQLSTGMKAGPARGWYQFECNGAVAGVMTHPRTYVVARALCDHLFVAWGKDPIWRALEGHDALATGFARLLLWSDPRPLPTTEEAGWRYYLDNWRPGKPHSETWAEAWASATRVLETQ